MARNGVLLINLGTPDDPGVPAVRRYLRQFLLDPRVIDIPAIARWLLVHGIILPTRPPKSSAAYKKIWTERGSPVLFHGVDLAQAVRTRLGADVTVEIAMRYQSPSIESALERMEAAGVDRIIALPLFPQYVAGAEAGEGALQAVEDAVGEHVLGHQVDHLVAGPGGGAGDVAGSTLLKKAISGPGEGLAEGPDEGGDLGAGARLGGGGPVAAAVVALAAGGVPQDLPGLGPPP